MNKRRVGGGGAFHAEEEHVRSRGKTEHGFSGEREGRACGWSRSTQQVP